MLAPIWDRWGL